MQIEYSVTNEKSHSSKDVVEKNFTTILAIDAIQDYLLDGLPRSSGKIEKIFDTLQPVIRRMLLSQMRKYNLSPNSQDGEDILQSALTISWKIIAYDFEWSGYLDSEHAFSALIHYLKLALSGLVPNMIYKVPKTASEFRANHVFNPRRVEEQTVTSIVLQDVFFGWSEKIPENQLQTMVYRHIDGMSVAEISQLFSVEENTIKKWISRAKKSLLLLVIQAGFAEYEAFSLVSDNRWLHNDRDSLLAERRELVALSFPKMQDLLPPKVRLAIMAFYGIGEYSEPLYSYEETAKKLGMSLQTVRVYIPQGFRLLIGAELPSIQSQVLYQERGIWNQYVAKRTQDQCLKEINREEYEVLYRYYDLGLSLREIATILKISETTTQRRREYGMNRILRLMNQGIQV